MGVRNTNYLRDSFGSANYKLYGRMSVRITDSGCCGTDVRITDERTDH